jgi:hypothetical protein
METVRYNLITKQTTLSLESKALMSSITFGFELEAILTEGSYDINYTLRNCFNGLEYNVGQDNSINPDQPNDIPFEAQFGVFPFTPLYLNKMLKGLQKLKDNGIITNDSCGFHVHLKFPRLTQEAGAWLILAIADDLEFQKELLHFKEFDFFDKPYAKTDFLLALHEFLKTKKYAKLQNTLDTSKYRVIRLHPQGTVEWRGPRNFLNEGNPKTIKEFVLLLYKIVSWMNNAMDLKILPTTKFSLQDFKNISLDSLDFNKPKLKNTIDYKSLFDPKSDRKAIRQIRPLLELANLNNLLVKFNEGRISIDISHIHKPIFKDLQNTILKDIEIIYKGGTSKKIPVVACDNCVFISQDKDLEVGAEHFSAKTSIFKDIEIYMSSINLTDCQIINSGILCGTRTTVNLNKCIINKSEIIAFKATLKDCVIKGSEIRTRAHKDSFVQLINCKIDSQSNIAKEVEIKND